ncbi:DUF1275 family protein [Actinacidiphila acidipaludis]|uniref:DUF1275 domain-containing protein n=1 Tax=Actinacidiphila acidipaludis TaxID=2873382 RepID=A0ABS7QIP6_9ACTN|nr:YoaK family protein [Streptomyces acidipaludis]MBY8882285.1 DUF1275 domain-containing protein [Streptomyces acidipaludis]
MDPREAAGAPARELRLAVVVLVAASGAAEPLSFLALDHVFAGVMTSNLALLGMAIGRSRSADVTAAVLALAGFGVGAGVVALVTRGRKGTLDRWPPRVLLCLAGEALLLAVGATLWAAWGGAPGQTARHALQCGLAAAMGAQAGAMVSAGRAAAPTTYLTGTLATYIVHGLSSASARPDGWIPLRLGALIAGAAVATAVLKTAPAWAGIVPCVLVVAAVLIAGTPFLTPRATGEAPSAEP